MTSPIFSLVYLTYRPGGFDLLVESLKYQEPIYELIVIDDYPGRHERGEVTNYIHNNGIPLSHYGPSKKHSYPEHCNGLANAMNTGASWARTNYVVFVHDFVWFPPGSMMQWPTTIRRYLGNTILSGIASRRLAKEPEKEGDVSIWHTPNNFCARNIQYELECWRPEHFENFYCGVPVAALEYSNGIDERSDCGHISWTVVAMAHQFSLAGCQLIVDPRLSIWMADHRHWKKFDEQLWSAESFSHKKTPPIPEWTMVSANPYDFKELRQRNIHSS